MEANDKDLLPPSIDPKKKAIGIRKVTGVSHEQIGEVQPLLQLFQQVKNLSLN